MALVDHHGNGLKTGIYQLNIPILQSQKFFRVSDVTDVSFCMETGPDMPGDYIEYNSNRRTSGRAFEFARNLASLLVPATPEEIEQEAQLYDKESRGLRARWLRQSMQGK